MRQAPAGPATPRQIEVAQYDALAADVQAQAGRLRDRLAQAPAPSPGDRNPFRFESRPAPAPARARVMQPEPLPAALDMPLEPREPMLQLIGVAETAGKDGPVRTAMLTGEREELLMVTAGQQILGRYSVVVIGPDAIELKDTATGAIRRLHLR